VLRVRPQSAEPHLCDSICPDNMCKGQVIPHCICSMRHWQDHMPSCLQHLSWIAETVRACACLPCCCRSWSGSCWRSSPRGWSTWGTGAATSAPARDLGLATPYWRALPTPTAARRRYCRCWLPSLPAFRWLPGKSAQQLAAQQAVRSRRHHCGQRQRPCSSSSSNSLMAPTDFMRAQPMQHTAPAVTAA
jgi:hypothetical protein